MRSLEEEDDSTRWTVLPVKPRAVAIIDQIDGSREKERNGFWWGCGGLLRTHVSGPTTPLLVLTN